MRHRASVEFDPKLTQPQSLIQAVRDSGYDAVLPRTAGPEASSMHDHSMESGSGWKAAITIAAGAAAMLFSMPLGAPMGPQTGGFDHALMDWMPWLYQLRCAGRCWR
jgi:hypothetical protein